MSRFFVGIILGFVMAVSQAQQINIPSTCISAEDLNSGLIQWKELPVARAQSLRTVDDNVIISTLVIFINSNTGAWTIVEELAEGKFCVVAMGKEFSPVPKDIIDQEKRRQEGH